MFKIGILALVLFFAIGCESEGEKPRDYDLEITYMNGDKDTVRMTCYSHSGYPPYLSEGCIRDYSGEDVSCYVRSFKILKKY
jgi:hypothetical protein